MSGSTIIHFQDVRAKNDDYVHAAIIGTGAKLEVTSGIINPDVARNASIKTTKLNSPSGVVKLEGINSEGDGTSEDITIIAGGIAYGNVAWVTLSKITLPAGVSAQDTVAVGISDKLGLGRSITNASNIIKKKVGALDKSLEIAGNVDTTYNTLDCATINGDDDITIWLKYIYVPVLEEVSRYITADDIDNFPDGLTTAEKLAIIDDVENRVELITHDYFYPKTFLDLLNGNGRDRLFLSIRQKILSVNYLAISNIALSTIDKTGSNISGTAGDYTVTLTISVTADYYKNNYLGIKYASEQVNNLWGSRILGNTATGDNGKSDFTLEQPLKAALIEADVVSIITNWGYDDDCIYRNPLGITHEPGSLMEPSEFYLNGYFPKGLRNVEIKGTIGHYSCPDAIKNACIILAKDENDPTLYEHYEFQKESMGRVYSYDRGDKEYISGIIEADRYLRRYINRGAVIAV